MNERIRELALQATTQVTKPDGHYIVQEWQRVFAELIVLECAKACEKNSYLALNGWQRAKQIREHFGVE